MADIDYLNHLRTLEMEQVIPLLPPGGRILEFGSGTGKQAKFLADHGFQVVAIDLPTSVYAGERLYPVMDYDGSNVPLEDHSVDAIFSSNVLEHVENLPQIMAEFRRVLQPGGVAIHVLPTAVWRFWTFATGIADAAKTATLLPVRPFRPYRGKGRGASVYLDMRRVARGLIPSGHGTSPEGISELWTFSRFAWRRRFRENGFHVLKEQPLGLFYSGSPWFGESLEVATRRRLASRLGSVTHLYVTQALSDRG